jgi:carbamoyltransferase
MYILGISGGVRQGNQDGSASLLKDGKLIAAAEEERFLKVKFAPGFLPLNSITFCLKFANISISDVSYVVFAGITYANITQILESYFKHHFGHCPQIKLVDHHMAHAASVFYTSGFDDTMVFTADLSGDGKCTTLCHGHDGKISVLKEFKRPNSLGIFYSMITQYLGFQRDSDEYKVMGLSSYGKAVHDFSWLLSYRKDEYSLDTKYLKDVENKPMPSKQESLYNEKFLLKLNRPRLANMSIDSYYKDIAKSAQEHLEKVALSLVEYLHEKTGSTNLCIAGGVALNVVMNQKLLQSKFVNDIYLTSVSGDNGLSLGAAIIIAKENGFQIEKYEHAFWGPEYTDDQIESILTRAKIRFERVKDISKETAHLVASGKIIGWFQGRMEFGARALGSRSILSDPRDKEMKDKLNKYVKFREDFRPFAPSVLEEKAPEYFVECFKSPFMAVTYDVKHEKIKEIPTPTHVDNTARVQTISKKQNTLYYDMIENFEKETGVPVVTNTSLNVMGQPICLSPVDALSTFYSTGMDGIVIGNYLLLK